MKKIIPFILLAICTSAFSQSALSKVCKPGTKLYVYAPTGLNFREKPDISGKILSRIQPNEEVEVINTESTPVFKADGIPGTWVHVKYKDQEGYLFDGYLSRFDAYPNPFAPKAWEDTLTDFLTIGTKSNKPGNFLKEGKVELGPDYEYTRIDFKEGVILEVIRSADEIISVNFPLGSITFQEMFLFCTVFFDTWKNKENKCAYNANGMRCTEGSETGVLELKVDSKFLKVRYRWQGGD